MHLRVLAALGVALALFTGCSDSESPNPVGSGGSGGANTGGSGGQNGGGGSGGADACPKLELGKTRNYRFTDASFSVSAEATPPVKGAYRTEAVLELYTNLFPTPDLPPLAKGTFDLGSKPNDHYETCQHCVTIITPDSSEIPARTFFQTGGVIDLTKLDELDPSIAVGKVTDVTLKEVEQADDGTWSLRDGGGCFTIPSWSFDTRPLDGTPCDQAEDCGNTVLKVCSPTTNKCSDAECLMTFDIVCPDGQLCQTQAVGEATIGACYQQCEPKTSGACPGKQSCVALDPVQSIGVCRPDGDGAIGDACDEPDVSTGCKSGSLCAGVPATCEKTCSYLTAHPGCPDGRACGLHDVCLPPDNGDPAKFGEACEQSWLPFRDCAADGEAFRGLCLSLYPEETVEHCQRTCRAEGGDCPNGEYCAKVFDNQTIGICWKTPVCGDGVVDPLNEVCDDGNAVSGDGCSGDCTTAEFDALCAKARPLVLDTDIQSTTEGAPTGYGGSCELYIVVPSKTFSFDVPGPGRLSLSLDSPKNLDLVVVGDCADPNGSELACQSSTENPETLDLDFATTPSGPLMIVVRGNTIPDVGAFTLRAKFTPAVCGDGVVVGPEVCDDGNTVSNDGCSADCLTIEWPRVCASLPELSTTANNTGDTSSAPNLNNTDSFCTAFSGSGGERMYRYTAPHDGKLTLNLAETGGNLALYVIDGCDAATDTNTLGCSNSGFPPNGKEKLEVDLGGGQAVTVVVDSFTRQSGGTFSLKARFQ